MKIIIAGAGEVGSHLAKMLSNESNNLTIIDSDESRLNKLREVADVIIVEVNKNLPICQGRPGTRIHIDQVDFIVEGPNDPLFSREPSLPGEVDLAIANLLLPELRDGACLQLGIGNMPNAIGSAIVQSDLKDLGIHTEMYTDSLT